MAVVLDDGDTKLSDLRILNEVALDISIKTAIEVIVADMLKVCQLFELNPFSIESHPSILSQSCDNRDSEVFKEPEIGFGSIPVIADQLAFV